MIDNTNTSTEELEANKQLFVLIREVLIIHNQYSTRNPD